MGDLIYSKAIKELETIAAEIEGDEVPVDALSEKVKRAAELIQSCRDMLKGTGEEVKKVLESFLEDKEGTDQGS
ncbi:MAG: exodeoxyribonuclease VII small subunit [Nitrospiraceae bacterium]|nr:exodeoxyribonuclease VII small subunit [Nitrospiraceae bacterium]